VKSCLSRPVLLLFLGGQDAQLGEVGAVPARVPSQEWKTGDSRMCADIEIRQGGSGAFRPGSCLSRTRWLRREGPLPVRQTLFCRDTSYCLLSQSVGGSPTAFRAAILTFPRIRRSLSVATQGFASYPRSFALPPNVIVPRLWVFPSRLRVSAPRRNLSSRQPSCWCRDSRFGWRGSRLCCRDDRLCWRDYRFQRRD
jgi:hypothetical protein